MERKLWQILRRKHLSGYRFRRQQPIGRYIVDFYCASEKLIIELDGGQHNENQTYDDQRTAWLNKQGYRVLRFWNNDITKNEEGVLQTIVTHLKPSPLEGEGWEGGNPSITTHG